MDVAASGRPDIDPEMGDMSPGLPAEGAGTGADVAGSSTLIAMSSVASYIKQGPLFNEATRVDAKLTISMASPSTAAFSFSLVFSLAFAFAVVESTAVATFSTVSFVGGLVGGGYANRLGRAFDTKSNLGGYKTR